jgi:N-acetylated-alpha-linked acidic dipeptidase
MWKQAALAAGIVAHAFASGAGAQGVPQSVGTPMPGFTAAGADRQTALERTLIEAVDPAVSRRHSEALAAEAHVAGTPAQDSTATYVLREMARFGFDTARSFHRVYLPHHDSTVVELVRPTRERFSLQEPPIPGRADAADLWPAMNGYSGAGDVTAPVVYANYGLAADYAALDSIGVSVRGRVVVARYGRSYRGIKAREAERNGAAALILYSDPADDGYVRGDVYPDGPMRHPDAVQRGSINNGRGDPSTPGWPSTGDARRVAEDAMELARIPVVPIGYRNAAMVLEPLGGADIPQSWQGGLPFRYHAGGDSSVMLRVAVWPERGDRAYKTIVNTFATLRGSDFPDEVVIAGGHRDAWGAGAVDNVTGIVSLLDAARAIGGAARNGARLRRTVVLATWDAEEWGLVGSIEWVEQEQERLVREAVAYLNQDVTAAGREFGAGASATLQPLMHAVTRVVPAPGDSGSVLAAWRRAQHTDDSAAPAIGDLGGGSDFAGFYNHLGIASASYGFGGPYGVYHSAYDNFDFLSRIADPGFLSHQAAARVTAVLIARLANADVVPLEPAALGAQLTRLVEAAAAGADSAGARGDFTALAAAADSLRRAGESFAAARDSLLASGAPADARLRETNRLLRGVERELTRPAGLVGREWFRNLVFASGRDDGYGNVALPSVAEAIEDGAGERLQAEIDDLSGRVLAAAQRVEAAQRALTGR